MITVDSNKICYVFDVDGTLTEPREEMGQAMASEFMMWSMQKQCFISTGSDFEKTQEQVPQHVLNCFKNIFCCMGNEVRTPNGFAVEKSKFSVPDELEMDLREMLNNSMFPLRTGNHLEFRTGMLNFSIVGRNADTTERRRYASWDKKYREREEMSNFINNKYPTLEASVGGSISIDIIELGCDKGQTVHALENAGATKIVFVGDKCHPGGNDFGFIRELKKSDLAFEWYNVKGPADTLSLIRTNKVFDGGR